MDNIQLVFHPLTTEQGGSVAVYSAIFDVGGFGRLSMFLTVADSGGTSPGLTTTIETSMDGNYWTNLVAFATVSGAGVTPQSVATTGRFVRAKFSYSGTSPWFSFSLLGIAREW